MNNFLPTKDRFLKNLIEKNFPITEVVDVGVRECTIELIENFGNKRHILFEPASAFYDQIEANYKNINYVLYRDALGATGAHAYMVTSSLEKNGIPTHCQISTIPRVVDGVEILKVDDFVIRRFDEIDIDVSPNFLLKVDVDGEDLNVLYGFGEGINKASAVIVEATYNTLSERLKYLSDKGFSLFDVVDLVYYGPGLYQCDLCFIRKDLINSDLRPDIRNFDRSMWHAIS